MLLRYAGRVALAGLVAGLAACAQPAAPSSVPGAMVLSPPPPGPAGVDGRYRGTARLVRAGNNFCPRSGPRTLELSGSVLTLSYSVRPRNRVPLTATIGVDGQIHAEDGVGVMDGRWANGRLEVTISSEMCEHRWTMTRID